MGWFGQKRLIRLARVLNHGFSKIFLCDFGDLLILFGLDDMGIHALKIRVDLAVRGGWGINNVVFAHWPFAWR